MEASIETTQPVRLAIEVARGSGIDDADLDQMTRSLQGELEDLDFVEEVGQQTETSVPQGAKVGEAVTLGALAMAILPGAIPALFQFLKAWSQRPDSEPVKIKIQRDDRSMELEFDPESVSSDEVQRLASELGAALLGK